MLAGVCFFWYGVQFALKEGTNQCETDSPDSIAHLAFHAVIVLAHYLGRYVYYGEWLPNTYFAKHVRPWYESGFRYLGAAALETGLYLIHPSCHFTRYSARWRRHRDASYALVLLAVCAHVTYLLPIGGDLFEYRPLDFYWPLLSLPASDGCVASLGSCYRTGLIRHPLGCCRGRFAGSRRGSNPGHLPGSQSAPCQLDPGSLAVRGNENWRGTSAQVRTFEVRPRQCGLASRRCQECRRSRFTISNDLRDADNFDHLGRPARSLCTGRPRRTEMISRWKPLRRRMERGCNSL